VTLAHHPVSPGEAWGAWTFEPATVTVVVLGLLLYGAGGGRLRKRSGGRYPSTARTSAFVAGMSVLVIALLSPVHALGETLFFAHMVQHLLLMLVVAPLFALAAPVVPMLAGIPPALRAKLTNLRRMPATRRARDMFAHPVVAWALQAAALWIWHLPGVYSAALATPLLHALEHASFLGTALVFWWLVVSATRRSAGLSVGVALVLVFATALQSGVLGAVLTFAARPLYRAHVALASTWGLSPLTDQQLAGLVMWIPAGMVYVVTMAMLFLWWLRAEERRTGAGLVAGSERT
jgi:putative membrane protein